MQVNLTEEQAVEIATNAINAALPVGMGFIHYEGKDYTTEEVATVFPHFDYFNGRMVKLNFRKDGDNFVFPDHAPNIEYQSWASKYPTYQQLIQSVVPDAVFQE